MSSESRYITAVDLGNACTLACAAVDASETGHSKESIKFHISHFVYQECIKENLDPIPERIFFEHCQRKLGQETVSAEEGRIKIIAVERLVNALGLKEQYEEFKSNLKSSKDNTLPTKAGRTFTPEAIQEAFERAYEKISILSAEQDALSGANSDDDHGDKHHAKTKLQVIHSYLENDLEITPNLSEIKVLSTLVKSSRMHHELTENIENSAEQQRAFDIALTQFLDALGLTEQYSSFQRISHSSPTQRSK